MRRKIGLLAAAVAGVTAAVPVPMATAVVPAATSAAATAPCVQRVGLQTADGMFGGWDVTATKPPTAKPFQSVGFAPATTSATFYYLANSDYARWYSHSIRGTGLYLDSLTYRPGAAQPEVLQHRVGGGWGGFTQLATSDFQKSGVGYHSFMYGLHTNGGLYRYNWDTGVQSLGSAKGFGTVKAMTVISETATYDTLLATTRGGALYTIRIPTTSPMKPIVKRVRDAGWQNFESLVVDSCGLNGILLTAVDHDTDTAYLYSVGHANSTATVIRGLGKIPATANGQTHYAMTREFKNLSGE